MWRRRRGVSLLLAAWVASRVPLLWFTANDFRGPYAGRAPAAHDLVLYEFWADQIGLGLRPYVDLAVEYPPANLPFLLAPEVVATLAGRSYETAFLLLAAGIDLAALVGLLLLRRRSGAGWSGPVAWLLAVPLLGPVALSRLDVIPACALIWTVLLLREQRWARSGVAFGIAVGTKVFAGLVLPAMAAAVLAHRGLRRWAIAAATAIVVPFTPFADIPVRLYEDLWEYHSSRGLVVESTWGSLLLAGRELSGQQAQVEVRFGAWEVVVDSAAGLKTVATIAVVAVAAHAATCAWRWRRDPDLRRLVTLAASTVVLSTSLGNVFSAQYVIWSAAAVAAAAATGARVIAPTVLVVVAAALTHLVFPVFFFDIVIDQDLGPTAILLARNAAMLTAGGLLLREALRPDARAARTVAVPSDPAVEEDEPVPVAG